jgi:hypothetical protein
LSDFVGLVISVSFLSDSDSFSLFVHQVPLLDFSFRKIFQTIGQFFDEELSFYFEHEETFNGKRRMVNGRCNTLLVIRYPFSFLYKNMSLGFAPSCGPIRPLSSMISMILAARANPTFNFLWRRVADAFLV